LNRGRTAFTPLEAYKTALEARDPDCVAIERIVKSTGANVSYEHQGRGLAGIKAIGAVQYIYRNLGEQLLHNVLVTVQEAWPDLSRERFTQHVLIGVATFYARYPEATKERTVAVLGREQPTRILAAARGFVGYTTGKLSLGVEMAIHEHYNKKLKNGRLPEWTRPQSGFKKEEEQS
jgi:hypothetical protein